MKKPKWEWAIKETSIEETGEKDCEPRGPGADLSDDAYHLKGLLKTIRMGMGNEEVQDVDAILLSLNIAEHLVGRLGDRSRDSEASRIKALISTIYMGVSNREIENEEAIGSSLIIAEEMMDRLAQRLENLELGRVEEA